MSMSKVIKGDVSLMRMYFNEIPEVLADVDVVDGSFNFSENGLSNLKNCPHTIQGDVFFSKNRLTTLVGGLKTVEVSRLGGIISFESNKLTNLEGFPRVYNSPNLNLMLGNNPLTTLSSNLPRQIKRLDLSGTQLLSLQGCPKIIGGDSFMQYDGLFLEDTNISSMIGGPEYIGGFLDISRTNISSFEGFPKKVNGMLICGKTPLFDALQENPYSELVKTLKSIFSGGYISDYSDYEGQFED